MTYSAPRSVTFPRARIALPEISPKPGTVEEVVVVPSEDNSEPTTDADPGENMESLYEYI